MNNYVSISLSNGLYNAGILGLIEFLKFCEYKDYSYTKEKLSINKEFFLNHDLATLYLDMIFDNFERESKLYSVKIADYDSFDEDKIKKTKVIEHNTPKTVCKIYGDSELIALRDKCNKLKDVEEKRASLKSIQQYLLDNNDLYRYLVIGDVTRGIFSQYFGTFAYLGISHGNSLIKVSNEDFEGALNSFIFKKLRDFIKDIENYKQDNEKYISCFQCRNMHSRAKNKFIQMRFLNDFVDDPNKKQSPFWNNKDDSYICPLCAFVYAFMPFGFIPIAQDTYARDRLFANQNTSIENIIKINSSIKKDKALENNKFIVLNTIVNSILEEKLRELDNIEIIVRECTRKKYSFDIIGKDILKVIMRSKGNLKGLVTSRIKIGKDWIGIFNEVLNNVLNYRNQWSFLYRLIKAEASTYVLNNVFNIQINQNLIKEGTVAMKVVDGKIKSARISGIELQRYFGIEAENKLRSFIYKLVNALGVGNKDLFLDTVVRMYSGINKAIPNTFINLFAGDERFKEIGYAYLLGLKSEQKEKEGGENE